MKPPSSTNLMVRSFIAIVCTLCFVPSLDAQQVRIPSTYRLNADLSNVGESSSSRSVNVVLSADSGSISVPEDPAHPKGRRLLIPVVRIRALDTAAYSPVVWLHGGPGQSNMQSVSNGVLLDSSDQVTIGYRGIDGSVSLDCPEVVDVVTSAGDILDTAVFHQLGRAYGDCARRIMATGVDPRLYTPITVAWDIEAARSALGADRITLVGESYGTRVAYYYAILFPEHVDRLVLIGPNPPGCMVWDPRENDRIIAQYGELWKEDQTAIQRAPDIVDAIRTVNRKFPKSWMGMPIHEGTVKAGANAFLFHRGTAALVFDMYAAAARGDASGLWLFSVVAGRMFPTFGNWGDNSSKALSTDFDPGRNYRHALVPPDAILGAPLGAFLWGGAEEGTWPYTRSEERFRSVEDCDVPTLFLTGALDPSTPSVNTTTQFVPHFPNGIQIVMANAGHVTDLWELQPDATVRLVRSFVRTGIADASAFTVIPMSFDVQWGFPMLAKVVLIGVIVVCILLAWAVTVVIQRFGSHKERIATEDHTR